MCMLCVFKLTFAINLYNIDAVRPLRLTLYQRVCTIIYALKEPENKDNQIGEILPYKGLFFYILYSRAFPPTTPISQPV